MPIPIDCPCGERLNLGDDLAGQIFRCPGCGRNHDVPSSSVAVRREVALPAVPADIERPRRAARAAPVSSAKFVIFIGIAIAALLIAGVTVFLVLRQRETSDDVRPRGAEGYHSADRLKRNLDNLKRIGRAAHDYHSIYGFFPQAAAPHDFNAGPPVSWRVLLLPYLEEEKLYHQWNFNEPWDGPNNRQLWSRMPKCYELPGHKEDGTKTYYQVFFGPGALFEKDRPIRIVDVRDGTANTIMVAESAKPVVWCEPTDIPFQAAPGGFDPQQVGGWFGKNVNVLMADGTVRTIPWKVGPQKFQAAITRAGGEVVILDD
jgi:hypothetical protein